MKAGESIHIDGKLAVFADIKTDEETGISTMTFVYVAEEDLPKPEDYNWMLEAHRKRKEQ